MLCVGRASTGGSNRQQRRSCKRLSLARRLWHSGCDWLDACRGKRGAFINPHAAFRRTFRTADGGAITSGEDSMSMLLNLVKSVARQDEGQDLLEYALLVALIALIAIGAVAAAGTSVQAIFNNIAGQLAAAA
jgi:Flp pilus assembly pilin Flp